MTDHEQMLITNSVNNALAFGTGVLTTCQEELEDYGYVWTEEHEKFALDTYFKEQE